MKYLAAFTVALLTIATLDCGSAHAQARGSSAKETLEKGQPIESKERWVRYKGALVPYSVRRQGPEAAQRFNDIVSERVSREGLAAVMRALDRILKEGPEAVQRFIAESMEPGPDVATVAHDVVELETWLRRLPGRFRIDGRIMMQDKFLAVAAHEAMYIPVVLSGEISGVTDCAAVGGGAGVQCILNATWPVIDLDSAHLGLRPSVSEGVKTMQPAMLVFGLDLETPGIRALLVTDESIANPFFGELTDNTLEASGGLAAGGQICPVGDRCLREMKITAESDGKIVTIIMIKSLVQDPNMAYFPETDHPYDDPRKVPPADKLIITLAMHRDPEAQTVVPMKTKKVR